MPQQGESNAIGCYANFIVVGHNAFEFVFDFGQLYQDKNPAHMHTRIVTTPVYAKAMLEAIRGSIERFEAMHGSIPGPDQ
jgi:hypothetical protein